MAAAAEPIAPSTREEKRFERVRLVRPKAKPEHSVDEDERVADASTPSASPPPDPIDTLPMPEVLQLLRSPVRGHATNTRASAARRMQETHGNSFVQRLVSAQVVQRQCACGGTCTRCREEEAQRSWRAVPSIIQRWAATGASADFDRIPTSGGESLDPATRRPLEAHFGADLSDVRVHTSSEAEKSATSLDALAYTSGRDIYFGAGMYAPASDSGRRLLAHEVAHVVQQGSGKEPTIATKSASGVKIGAPEDILEAEADQAADQFMSSTPTDEEKRKRHDAGVTVQRWIQRQGHELAHVLQQSGRATPNTIQRQSVPLPDYRQKGDTCDPASLTSALILWDRESAGSGDPNANIVGVCNAALIFMTQNKATLVAQYGTGGADGSKTFDDNYNQLTATRDRLRGAGKVATEVEYQGLSIILSGFGSDADEVLRKLGLKKPATESAENSLADIFADPALNALKPGETAQILWYVNVRTVDTSGKDLGVQPSYHAFLIGKSKAGTWFLSNQADTPPLHLEASTLADLRTALDKASAAGQTKISTNPSLTRLLMTWTGVKVLPQQDYSQPFRSLAPPGTFLAEVDETTFCCGERLTAWDFVGTGYSDKDINALLASSGTGHGFLIGEMPAGVFSVYKTNPVTDPKNAAATKIDIDDSRDGLLMKSVFVHAWLKLRTPSDSSATGKGFMVR